MSFWEREKPYFGRKHLRAQILKRKSLKKKEIEEEKMGLSLKIVYSHYLSFFLFLLMVFFHLEMF